MSKRIYTREEQEVLRNNPHIASCSERSIVFTTAFKQYVVREHKAGKIPQRIFAEADIPISLIGRQAPKNCIHRWIAKDVLELGIDGRGRHGKAGRKRKEYVDKDKMTKDERIAYLEAENDFLAQLRGIPRASFRYRPGNDT
jgi:transposase